MIKRKIRVSYETIIDKLNSKFNGNIVMLTNEENYKGTHYDSEFECKKCKNIWKTSINKILTNSYKSGCLICRLKTQIQPQKLKEIQKEIQQKFNIQILTNDNFLLKTHKYNFLCNKCNFIWKSNLGNILNQKGACTKCNKGHYHYNIDEIKTLLYKNHQNKIIIFEESYISISKPSKFKCNVCNYEWCVKTRNVVNGFNGCPSCKGSQGERFIKSFLTENKIEHFEQFTFDNCKNKRKLPFDFYIKDNICIEFDGRQHFSPWKDDPKYINDFKQIQINDKLKDEYCYNNQIKLIRIPYIKIKEIDNILKKELNYNEIFKNIQ
jgi:hypothetical protein